MSPPPNNPSPAGSTPLVSPKPSPAHQPRSTLPGPGTPTRDNLNINTTTPSRTDSFASGAWSTVATPGVTDDEGREKRFDLNRQPTIPSAPPADQMPRSPSGDKKNVRFAGPDGAPLSPAQTHITVDSYDAPDAPPPTTTSSSPTTPTPPTTFSSHNQQGGSSSSSDPSDRQRSDSTATSLPRPSAGGNGNGNGTILPSAPPPSLASAPSFPPAVPQPHGLGLSSPTPSAPPMPALTSAPPTRKQVEQTQKHARWAISALEFDDIETARSELRKALATIGG
jgi:vacuolar protein sorting-associated protein VTA1